MYKAWFKVLFTFGYWITCLLHITCIDLIPRKTVFLSCNTHLIETSSLNNTTQVFHNHTSGKICPAIVLNIPYPNNKSRMSVICKHFLDTLAYSDEILDEFSLWLHIAGLNLWFRLPTYCGCNRHFVSCISDKLLVKGHSFHTPNFMSFLQNYNKKKQKKNNQEIRKKIN